MHELLSAAGDGVTQVHSTCNHLLSNSHCRRFCKCQVRAGQLHQPPQAKLLLRRQQSLLAMMHIKSIHIKFFVALSPPLQRVLKMTVLPCR